MSEFASTAMIKVILSGMKELGIYDSSDRYRYSLPKGPTIDISSKRALLNHVVELAGVQSLVLLGRGVKHFTEEPTYKALISSVNPVDVFLRWQKLERYIHSSHRIVIEHNGESSVTVLHQSKRDNTQPSLSESLVVVGVLAGLLESMGAQGLAVYCDRYPIYPHLKPALVPILAVDIACPKWVFRWSSLNNEKSRATPRRSADIFQSAYWPDIVKQVGNILRSDLLLPATLKDIASTLETSQRTLQRKLAEQGFSYREILSKTRGNMAAWFLLETATSLSEIGYLTGYSDQAHFTRDFRAQVGLTPAMYRKNFLHI